MLFYITSSRGTSSNPVDFTDYDVIKVYGNAINLYIRCRCGTFLYLQTPNIGNYINCTVWTNDVTSNNLRFETINVGEQQIQHWVVTTSALLCTFSYQNGGFGTQMGLTKSRQFV